LHNVSSDATITFLMRNNLHKGKTYNFPALGAIKKFFLTLILVIFLTICYLLGTSEPEITNQIQEITFDNAKL
jgi:hypothetical protein